MALTDDEVLVLLDLELDGDIRAPQGRLRSAAWWLVLTLGVVAASLVLLQVDYAFVPPRFAG